MINIIDKKDCSGCSACVDACPVNIISMTEDKEGFVYPKIRVEECIECGLCNDICSMENYPLTAKEEEEYYAACVKKEEDLEKVSSGGVAWALSQYMISIGGVVYGAVQTDVGIIKHMRGSTIEEIEAFRKSKYLQSIMTGCYEQVENDLKSGKKVLFTGTPCQTAAIKQYVGRADKLLYTCDIVCHGVPSNKAFRIWKKEIEEINNAQIIDIIYRDKTYGYNNNHYAVSFSNGVIKKEFSGTHAFHKGYLKGVMYRPACSVCPFATLPRVSDITLADYWKYKGKLDEINCNRGISLVVCSSEKGKNLFKECTPYLHVDVTDKKSALNSCRHLTHSPMKSEKREIFFEELDRNGYYSAMKKCELLD